MSELSQTDLKILRHLRGDDVQVSGLRKSEIEARRLRLRAKGYLRFGEMHLTAKASEILHTFEQAAKETVKCQ